MKLNTKKTKCTPFNNSLTKDFVPQLQIKNRDDLEVIYKFKLVGLVVTSDMTWQEHVSYTVGRVNKVLWQLTRFKHLGASTEQLLKFYILKIRSILMFGAVCYHSALTLHQRYQLELQQKRSLAYILGNNYCSHDQARTYLKLPSLEELREEACTKWALKALANPQHRHLFPKNNSIVETRGRQVFLEQICKSAKYFNSAVPNMIRSLNRQAAGRKGPVTVTTKSGIVIVVWSLVSSFVCLVSL